MTDLRRGRDRPRAAGAAGPVASRPSVVLHAALTALGAALSGLAVVAAVVLVAWVADARTGASGGDAVRAAADAWLLAHRGGLRLPAGSVGAVPLGLTVLAAVLLHRAGASLARAVEVTDLPAAARAAGALTAVYALATAAVARLAAAPTVAASALAAGIGAALLAAAAGGSGVVRGADLGAALRAVLPAPVPAVARAAATGVLALLGAGAALVLLGLGVHAGRFADLTRVLDPGLVGGAVLVLGCLLLLPNAAVWAVAYAAGPGFAVGAGTAVSPFGATLGPVPALPLLAALPQDGSPPPVVRAVLVLPVLAGVVVGVALARRLPAPRPVPLPAAGGTAAAGTVDGGTADGGTADAGTADAGGGVGTAGRAARAAGWGLVAGLAAAAAVTVLAALSGGPLGDGYLAAVGPSPWRVALALAVEIGVPAALTAALLPAGGRGRTPVDRSGPADESEPAEPSG